MIKCPTFEVFYGGARGGGKTDAMLGDFAEHANVYGPNANGIMFRRTRTELIDTIERSRTIYGPIGWRYHEQDKLWRTPDGAKLRFAYLERDADALSYQGHSYTRVYVEEIGNFPSDRPILKLMATLRSGAGVPCGFRATGNPGGPGHAWVRSRYVDPAPAGNQIIRDALSPLGRVYIPARVDDNLSLDKDLYKAQLSLVGSAELVRCWLEGDWSAVEGAFFDGWSQEHVIPPFTIPSHWLRFRSCDWGFASPFSVGWWAVAGEDVWWDGATRTWGSSVSDQRPGAHADLGQRSDHGVLEQRPGSDVGDGRQSGRGHDVAEHVGSQSAPSLSRGGSAGGECRVIPRGALVRYREYYGGRVSGQNSSSIVGLRRTAEEVGADIVRKEVEKVAYGVLDRSAFKNEGGPPIGETLNRIILGAGKAPFRPSDSTKIAEVGHIGGWDMMRARIKGHDGRPMIYCFDTCKDSIRTIPVLQHHPDKPEDIADEQEDHAADEWRYACMSRPYVPKPAAEKPKPKELGYEVLPDGSLKPNMTVMDYVQERIRRKKRMGRK